MCQIYGRVMRESWRAFHEFLKLPTRVNETVADGGMSLAETDDKYPHDHTYPGPVRVLGSVYCIPRSPSPYSSLYSWDGSFKAVAKNGPVPVRLPSPLRARGT